MDLSNLSPLKNRKKRKNVTLLFGEVFVDVAVVVAEVSYYFQPGAPVFQLK